MFRPCRDDMEWASVAARGGPRCVIRAACTGLSIHKRVLRSAS